MSISERNSRVPALSRRSETPTTATERGRKTFSRCLVRAASTGLPLSDIPHLSPQTQLSYHHCIKSLKTPQNNSGYTSSIDLSLIHISEPTRLLSISYAVFCLKKKNT